ncbi:translin-associated factor X-interacting protein 1 [Pelodytes ibericus]
MENLLMSLYVLYGLCQHAELLCEGVDGFSYPCRLHDGLLVLSVGEPGSEAQGSPLQKCPQTTGKSVTKVPEEQAKREVKLVQRAVFHLSKPINFKQGSQCGSVTLLRKANPVIRESCIGNISFLPSYRTETAILQKRKPCLAPDINDHRTGNVGSKPRFLEQLESHLKKELQSLDLTKENGQELRLQAYSEVFNHFIEGFKTYKLLLSAIKNEYEVTLAHQRQQICSLEPLKTMLATASERCDQKIQAIRQEERLEIKNLRKEKLNLLKVIDNLKEEQISLQLQVSKLSEELANVYLLYRNERDARKLLISKMNDLKYHQEEMRKNQITDVHKGDPVTLEMALRVARKDLTQTQIELNTMKADYRDVVPRSYLKSKEKQLAEFQKRIDVLKKNLSKLQSDHQSLLAINNLVLKQRDSFCNQVDKLQRASTLRPKWEKYADVFPGGPESWMALSTDKSSDQLVDILVTELGIRMLQDKDFFEGKGQNDNVPVHLHHEGLVKNLKLSINEVSNIVQDVWKEKITSVEQDSKSASMPQFFLSYLQKKFGDAAIEWSYSVHETCRVHLTSDEMHHFYKLLMGRINEDQGQFQNSSSLPNKNNSRNDAGPTLENSRNSDEIPEIMETEDSEVSSENNDGSVI